MADLKPFAGMSQEETQTAILYYLAAILDKLPRTDGNDRLVTNPSEVAPSTTPVSGSLTTVTNVTTVAALQTLGTNSMPANAMPLHMANAGANFLYDRIVFA